jgi:hypothetical protein
LITAYSYAIITTYESISAILVLPTNPKVVAFEVVTALAANSTIINYIALVLP